jgi:hypothetical protein
MGTIFQPAIELSESAREELTQTAEESGQVVVHVTYEVKMPGEGLRIWPTTYLVPDEQGGKCPLIMFHNISLAPFWTIINKKGPYRFTLYFSALPKGCHLFHLFEDIDQPGRFMILNIRRNNSDVYEVKLDAGT